VERRGHAEGQHALRTGRLEPLGRIGERRERPGHDHLAGGVVVRDDEAAAFDGARHRGGVEADDRGHATGRIGGLHELTPPAHQTNRIGKG